jgi:hypothetical protein
VKTNQTENQIKKATNSIAAGLRILRKLEDEGTDAEQAERAAARQQLADILTPAIEGAEKAVAEVCPLRDQWGMKLTHLMTLRGKVQLPGGGSSWYQIEQAEKLINDGIASYERTVESAKRALSRRIVGREQLVDADATAKELRFALDLPQGVRYLLGKVEDIMSRVVENAGSEVLAELTAPEKPAEPGEPTDAEKYADQQARAWRRMFNVDDEPAQKPLRQQQAAGFDPFKA